jgi:hypothetical protein
VHNVNKANVLGHKNVVFSLVATALSTTLEVSVTPPDEIEA